MESSGGRKSRRGRPVNSNRDHSDSRTQVLETRVYIVVIINIIIITFICKLMIVPPGGEQLLQPDRGGCNQVQRLSFSFASAVHISFFCLIEVRISMLFNMQEIGTKICFVKILSVEL